MLLKANNISHLGPQFPTFISHNSATSPDNFFSNKHNYINTLTEPGDITTSDHIPVILTVSTRPIYIKTKESCQYNKAKWEDFKEILNNKFTERNLNNFTIDEIDQELNSWMRTVKYAMNKTIPKRSHKPIYQTVTTPQIQQLEREYNTLRHNATLHGWTQNIQRTHTYQA